VLGIRNTSTTGDRSELRFLPVAVPHQKGVGAFTRVVRPMLPLGGLLAAVTVTEEVAELAHAVGAEAGYRWIGCLWERRGGSFAPRAVSGEY